MNTLRSLYWEPTRATRFLTIIACLPAAIGIFMRRHSGFGDLHLAFHLASWYVWSGALMLIAIHRYWCLWRSAVCGDDCLETKPGIVVCVLAIFVWSVLLASSAIASDFGLALMLIVCIAIEGWLLSRHLEQLKAKRARKRKGAKCE